MCTGSVWGLLLFYLLHSLLSSGFKCYRYAHTPKYPSQTQVSCLHFRSFCLDQLLTLQCLRLSLGSQCAPRVFLISLSYNSYFSISSGQLNWSQHRFFPFTTLPILSIAISFISHQHLPRMPPVFTTPTIAACVFSHYHCSGRLL